jgi:steroid delta-isomerase-like uncharacterized protein
VIQAVFELQKRKDDMSGETNKKLFERIVNEAWNKGELAVLDEVVAKDFIYHDLMMPLMNGPEGYKAYIRDVRASYPDFHMTIEDVVMEGDKIAARIHWTGTDLGISPAFKVPATGKKVDVTVSSFNYFVDGKLTESWAFQDWVRIMRQLGLMPGG